MDYKKLMGYNEKKKTPKPKVNKVLNSIKEDSVSPFSKINNGVWLTELDTVRCANEPDVELTLVAE